MPRSMIGVNSVRTDMWVYISLSQSHIIRDLSPTRLLVVLVGGIERGRGEVDLRLIVTFRVRDCLLAVSSVCQGVGEITNVPLAVFLLFQKLDVHVWDGHA